MPLTKTSTRPRAKRPPVREPADARKPTLKNEALIAKVAQRATPSPVPGATVLAIDPGGASGVAARFPDGRWLTNTLTDPADLWDLFTPPNTPDFCVFEIFSTGGRVDKYMIYTIELVGGIKAVCYALGVRGFAHSPSKRYPWLELAERMLKGQAHTRHEVDALAHLLCFEELRPDAR